MAYWGLVPTESSSGATRHRGHITKTGNALLRHVLGEAAHPQNSPTSPPRTGGAEQRGAAAGSHMRDQRIVVFGAGSGGARQMLAEPDYQLKVA